MNNLYYLSYNSIISEGQRIRRMRRTQLSMEKVVHKTTNHRLYHSYKPSSKNKNKSNNSLPKVQTSGRFHRKLKPTSHKNHIPNEYYLQDEEIHQSLGISTTRKQFYRTSNLKASSSNHNPPPRIQAKAVQLYSYGHSNTLHHQSSKQRSLVSEKQLKKSKLFKKTYKLNSNTSNKSIQCSGNFSEELLKKSQQFENSSEMKENPYYFKNKSSKKIILNEFSRELSKIATQSKNSKKQPQSQLKFNDYEEKLEEGSEPFSKFESQGMSILKLASQSQSKKTSSIRSTSNGRQKKSFSSKQEVVQLSKRMSLKLQSIKREKNLIEGFNDTGKTSFRNLPLTSRSNSQRRSYVGQSRKSRPLGNTLEEVIERIQIHDFIITLLSDFSKETIEFYNGNQEKYQRMRFLLERKHFLQKNNMIKALRGGKNVFIMSSIEIPNEILKNYLSNVEIKSLADQHQERNKKLFKDLERFFRRISKTHEDDPFIKLQTPSDTFSKCLVNDLSEELNQLYPFLEKLAGQKLEMYQNRIIEIMEKMFVLSEFTGRKVKKLEFAEQIDDFYAYYDNNYMSMMDTIQYFQQMP